MPAGAQRPDLAAAGEVNEGRLQLDAAESIFRDPALAELAGPAMQPLEARLHAARGELYLAQSRSVTRDTEIDEHRKAAEKEFHRAATLFEQIGDGRSRSRYREKL